MLCIILNPTYLNFVVVNFYHKITTFLGKKKSKQKRKGEKKQKNPQIQRTCNFLQYSLNTQVKLTQSFQKDGNYLDRNPNEKQF